MWKNLKKGAKVSDKYEHSFTLLKEINYKVLPIELKQDPYLYEEARYSERIFIAKNEKHLYFLFFVVNGDIGRERIVVKSKIGYRTYQQNKIKSILGRRMTATELEQAQIK